MTNNYSIIKSNQSSVKYVLVRIEPARFVNDSLVLDASTTYTMTFPYDISKVEEQGSGLALVTGAPSTSEYSYNESTKLLTVNLAAVKSSTNAIVVFYYLYYTIERFRVVGQDPSSPTVNYKEWRPKIISSPVIQQSIGNVIEGKLSISSSSIQLINDNADFNQYLSNEDSFYNKKVQIWHVLDDIQNFSKVFEGLITGISVTRQRVTIDVRDALSLSTAPATMGDTKIYYTNDHFTNVPSSILGQPVKYYFGTVSRYDTLAESVTNLTTAQKLDPNLMEESYCTNFTTDITTSNNRTWGIGRVSSNGVTNFAYTIATVDNSDANFTRIDATSSAVARIHIGDTFKVTGSGTYYERVYYVDRVSNYIYLTKEAGIIATDVINSNSCPSLVITDFQQNFYYPLYDRDYTASETILPSGNILIEITFKNNFEANLSMATLDPTIFRVFFKIKPDIDNTNHSECLEEILTKAGMTTNASSFTTAASSFNVNAAFSIPSFDELDYSPYYKYIENILSSVLGYIYLNSSFEIVYKLFSTPSPSTQITNTEIINKTPSYQIDYLDIKTQIVGYNPHFNSSEYASVSSASATSNKSRYLHGVDITTRFVHVLEDFSSKITDHINLRSERNLKLSFSTKGINFDSSIGDEFNYSSIDMPGNTDPLAIVILETKKGNTETDIVATDLYNL